MVRSSFSVKRTYFPSNSLGKKTRPNSPRCSCLSNHSHLCILFHFYLSISCFLRHKAAYKVSGPQASCGLPFSKHSILTSFCDFKRSFEARESRLGFILLVRHCVMCGVCSESCVLCKALWVHSGTVL